MLLASSPRLLRSFLALLLLVPTAASAATFTLSPTSVSFGNQVLSTTSSAKTITLTNTGASVLAFTAVPSTAEFTASSTCSGGVNPGATCNISIQFRPTALLARSATLVVTDTTNPSNTLSASLTGTGVTATTLSATSLAFGNAVQGTTSKAKKLKLTNNLDVPLTGLTFSSSNPDFSVSGCGATLAAHKICTASVTFTPSAAPGSSETGTLTITHSAVTSPEHVALSGKSVLPLSFSAPSLVFPATAQGTTKVLATLKLTNNLPVSVTNIAYALTGSFTATGCAPPLAAGKSCTLSITFAPTTAQLGLVTGSITVSSTNPLAWNHPVATLSGTAFLPISITANPTVFPDTTVAATSAAKKITIKNVLTTTLTLGASPFSFGGSAAADFARTATTCGTSLAAGASCTVSVTFHPTVGGSRTGTFIVASSAPGSPHSASLTGNGTTPITVSPVTLAFGNTGVGLASAAKLVTLKNNQSVAQPISVGAPTGNFVKDPSTTCGATLAAGASCTVAIVMQPKVGGTQTGVLTVLEPPFAALNVPLSGTGINAMTTSVGSLTFAQQKVGTTSISKQIIVTNHGNIPATLATLVGGNFAATDSCGGIVPALSTCVVSVTFTPASLGALTGSISFADQVTAGGRVTVNLSGTGTSADPPASLTSVAPGAGTVGTVVSNVAITGSYTQFTSGTPTVSFGAGVTVSGVTVINDTSLVVGSVTIAAGATPGARNVQVTNGSTTASLTSGFVVSASAAKSFSSISPSVGAQGQTFNVAIVGVNTHFAAGVTTANFGDNVYVNGAVSVTDQTHATANITISPTAVLGWRAVTVVTGGEYATLTPVSATGPGFNVIASGATVASITPATGEQGAAAFVVTVVGTGTHFLQGASTLSVGAGINVGSTTVDSPTQLHATIAVTAGATPGLRDVTVTTGGEIARRPGAFTVTPSATIPYLSGVSPSSGQQGQTLTLTFTGVNTHFTTDAPQASLELGSNITVNSVLVLSDTSIQANVSIALVADVGARGGILSSGPTNYPFTFLVAPSVAQIVSVVPGSTGQGTNVSVTVTGLATHWTQDTTVAWFLPNSCLMPQVDRVTVNSPTSAVLDITVPPNACVGADGFQMATGGEIVGSALNVYRKTPSVTLSPSSAMIGTTQTVNFIGEFSHFAPGSTTAVIDGTGVQIQSFTVTGPTSATAKFVIAPDAPSGGCYTSQLGCHTVTVTSPLASGSEILTALFQVTSTPAILVSIDPTHLAPGNSSLVRVIGSYTHFVTGTTTVGVGPDITVSAATVISPTELTVNVSVGSNAAIGWRNAYVNTGAEQLTIGFRVDGPATPQIASVSPASAAQGETLFINITGQNTNFSSASELILGAGVTVADFHVTGPTTATAVIAVSPTAPVGPNAVIVLTPMGSDQEVASGAAFSVTRGPQQILSVTPAVATQSQILNIAIVGSGTHWLQGGSTADFGPGVVVNALTVADATHASAQITILSTAPLGFHTVSMQTDGEYVSMTQGLNITEATPVLLSTSPNAGQQGTTFNVQVLGQQTHWVQGATTASYGYGITVNSVTVLDSASATLNVTVDPLAFPEYAPACHSLTMTTGTEQVSLLSQLCVQPGAAVVTNVNPGSSPRGQTLTVTVTGQNTHFTAGLTTADFGVGINVSAVTVTNPTTASVDLAVTSGAPNGYHSATMRTLGESAYAQYAFIVGNPPADLASVSPNAGQQGQSLTVHLLGQSTHWVQGTTTVAFGTGVAISSLTIVDATHADAAITIDPLTFLGPRTVTVTTGGEIVSGNKFTVLAGPAIIATSTPQSGNQGQDIVLTLTGLNTHWSQGATQFSMGGLGIDIKLNYFLVNSATSATAGITISPTAALGSRSIYMITGGESLVDLNAFVVTGGIPVVASVNPGSGKPGDTGLNVQIAGLYTHWDSTSLVDFGPGVTVQNFTVNSSTSITAVVGIDIAAGLGTRTVTVRTGTQALTGYFQVVSPTPPTPYISYQSPSSGLRGQTFTVTFAGQFTHWDPGTSTVTFGDPGTSNITINSFQVTSPTSARANITIGAAAPLGTRTVQITTGPEIEQSSFSVVIATPVISIVDPYSAMQGATLDVNVLGQNTTFDATTVFDFGPDVTVNSKTILGPTVAQVNITIGILATLGGRSVTGTTGSGPGAEIAYSTYGFTVTPSEASLKSVTPNTARQRDTIDVDLVGDKTHWDGNTKFSFGDGVSVTATTVTSPTTATVTINLAPLATLGARTVTATTIGEIASLTNAFIVQPGTAVILSSAPTSAQQQQNVSFTILGQFTQWANGATTVDYGSGVTVNTVNVTSPISITVSASVEWWAQPGYRTLTVTTGGEVLTLPSAFYVTNGPAAISALNPATSGQGETHNVIVTGVNTHFANGVTMTGTFGAGISLNSISVASPTSATVNITVAANAAAGQRSVALYTQGETAGAVNAFTVVVTQPSIQFVSPISAAQGATLNVSIFGSLTSFTSTTTFDFGPGITVNSRTITDATHASANITISPLAVTNTRNVCATGATTACGSNLFTVNAGPAYISAISPNQGKQNTSGLVLTISGNQTHFLAATPVVSLGPGVSVTNVSVTSDTILTATANISPSAPVQVNNVIVTTLGEVAVLTGGFTVQTGDPAVTTAVPTTAHQGDTLNVAITGLYTHFVNGTTGASFGSGITVNSVTVTSQTQATVNISINQGAAVSSRNVTMTTGSEVATGLGVFTVLAGVPSLDTVNPTSGAQGSTQTLTITGLFTHFQSGVSTVSFSSSGVTFGAVTVNGPTQIQVPVTVTVGAPAGARTVTVTTGTESVSKIGAFTVLPGNPQITIINPNVGVPNSTVPVSITGQFTNFVNGTTQARFGAGISVNGGAQGGFGFLTVTSATTANATLTIDAAAALGARDVRVQTGAEVLDVNAGFTVQSAAPTAPGVTFISPANNSSGVPTNTAVTLQFSAPLDRTTVSAANIRLVDTIAQGLCYSSYTITTPGTVTVDASARIVTLTPAAVLAVGRQYSVCMNYGQQGTAQSIKDPAGHDVTANYFYFTTGFAPDTTGPSFVGANITDGATGVPTNAPVVLGFSKAINPATVGGNITVTTGGSLVGGTFSYTPDYKQITFTPSSALAASTIYVATFTSGLEDSVGNTLTNPGSVTFTTGTTTDTSGPILVSVSPISGAVTGTSPSLRATFNEPLNPLRETNAVVYLYNAATNLYYFDGTVVLSPDRKTVTLIPARSLDPGTWYNWYVSAYNIAGGGTGYSWSFRTSGSADVSAPSVASVSPPGGTTAVPVNAKPQVVLSEPIDPIAVTLTSVPSVTFTYTLSSDQKTLTFAPAANLAASTSYSLTLAGVKDLSGNVMAPYGWSFTTSAVADTTAGTIVPTPAAGATGVAPTTPIVLSLSEPVDPTTVNEDSVRVYDNTVGQWLAGSRTISADLRTVTFTPGVGYVGGHQVCPYVSYYVGLKDLAGNNFNYVIPCFTVAAAVDSTPPTVISVTPFNGATGIGPYNPVTVTFSETMRTTSLQSSVALYAGSDLVSSSFAVSLDTTSLTYSGNLAWGTTYTVVVSPGATDLAGNSLAALFTSTFTTAPRPATVRPQVQPPSRPASGATGVDPSASVVFFLTQPVDPATVNGNMFVSQNGVLLTGTTTVSHSNRVITFVPSGPFAAGALIEVWLTSGIADTAGNQLYDYQTSFRIAPGVTGAATVLSYTPAYGATVPSTSVIDIRFSKPINPATVTSSSYYLTTCSSTPVPTTRQLLTGNTVLRLTPTAPLPVGCYYYYLTTAVTDTGGLPVDNTALPIAFSAGVRGSYINTTAAADTTSPSVVGAAPTDGAVNIAANAIVRLTFSEALSLVTINPSTLSIQSGGSPVPYDVSSTTVNPDGTLLVRLTPGIALPASSSVTVSVTSGVTDASGNGAVPFTETFTTSASPDFSLPVVIASTVSNGDADVPVTSVFTATFDRPMDIRSFVSNSTIYLYEPLTGIYRPHTLSFSADRRQVTLAPASPLGVGRSYQFTICYALDLAGNQASCYSASFTTALFAPTGGPAIVQLVPYEGLTVPINFKPRVRFDRAVSQSSFGSVTLTAGAVSVPLTASFTTGDTIVALSPSAVLQPNTVYTLTISGVTDTGAHPMSAPVVVHFTTGPALDLTPPAFTRFTPPSGAVTGTNPVVRAWFSEPLDPVRATGGYLYNNSTGRYVPGTTFVFSPQWTSIQITYTGPLAANSSYSACMPTMYDLAGNNGSQPCWSFVTGSGIDAVAPTVAAVTPPNSATGVPRNATIAVQFSERMDPTTLTGSAGISLSPVVAGTQQLSTDGMVLTFTPAANLNASTVYGLNVSGLADLNGNVQTPFSSSFTTGSLVDVAAGTISMTNPAPGSTGVSVGTSITLTLNKAVDPTSLAPDSIVVYRNGSTRLAGSVTIGAGGTTLIFTPQSALPPGSAINIYAGYYVALKDLAGNVFNYLGGATFTTAAVADTTPPTILSVSPANGATGVGPQVTVTLAFSESLDPSTINENNFALYAGFTRLGYGVSRSTDNRIVTLAAGIPYGTTITLVVDTDVTDINGNALAAPFQSTFTTLPQPLSSSPSVTQMRPANGASGVPTDTRITLYATDPIAPASMTGALAVTQNGVQIAGTWALVANGYALAFTPSSSLAAGALIQVFLTNSLTNTSGTPFQAYSGIFSTAPDTSATPLQIVSYVPAYGSTQPANTIVDVQFNKPIDPAFANSTYFDLTDSSSNPVAVTVTQVQPTVLRLIPSSTLAVGPYYYFHVKGTMKAVDGTTLGSQFDSYFYTSAVDAVVPVLQSVVPVNGATNVGDNATIRFSFNKVMDTLSINGGTLTLKSAGVPVPFSLSFGSTPAGTTFVTMTPQAPLDDNSAIAVIFSTGIIDRVGQPIAAQTVTFQTANGPDTAGPGLLSRSPDPTQTTGVPTNTQTYTWVYDEVLSPAAPAPNTIFVYQQTPGVYLPGTISFNGTKLTLTLASPLNPSTAYSACSYYPTDMTGNVGASYCHNFTTAATASAVGPQVVVATPTPGITGAPRNPWIEVLFDKSIDATSLGAVTVKNGAVTIPFTPTWTPYFGGRSVRFVPAAVLDPNSTYTVTVTGVLDLAGIAMSAPYVYSFTTGPDLLFNETTLSSASALVGGVQTTLSTSGSTTGVSRTAPLQVTFTDPVAAASLMNNGARLVVYATSAVIPVTVTLSADGKTASVTPVSPLDPTTQYQLQINYAAAVYNQAGYQVSGYSLFNFTTTF